MGEGSCFAFPPGASFGERWIEIGSGTLIGPGVALSAGLWEGEDLRPASGSWVVRIGGGCNVGRLSSIAGRTGIDIGHHVTIGPGVFITDHNHDYGDPRVPVMRQWIVEDPVVIGAGSWLGVGSVILPGTTLGENVVVAAGAVVRGDVPPRTVVAGAPARVVRRWDEAAERWEPAPGRPMGADRLPPGWYDEPAPAATPAAIPRRRRPWSR